MQKLQDTHAVPDLEGFLQPFLDGRGAMFSTAHWQAVQRLGWPRMYSYVAAAWLLSACLLANEQSMADHPGNEALCWSAGIGR